MFFHPVHQRRPVDDSLKEIAEKRNLYQPSGQATFHMIHPIFALYAFLRPDDGIILFHIFHDTAKVQKKIDNRPMIVSIESKKVYFYSLFQQKSHFLRKGGFFAQQNYQHFNAFKNYL